MWGFYCSLRVSWPHVIKKKNRSKPVRGGGLFHSINVCCFSHPFFSGWLHSFNMMNGNATAQQFRSRATTISLFLEFIENPAVLICGSYECTSKGYWTLGQLSLRTSTLEFVVQQVWNLIPDKIQTSIHLEKREEKHHRYYFHWCPLCISKARPLLLVTPWLTV